MLWRRQLYDLIVRPVLKLLKELIPFLFGLINIIDPVPLIRRYHNLRYPGSILNYFRLLFHRQHSVLAGLKSFIKLINLSILFLLDLLEQKVLSRQRVNSRLPFFLNCPNLFV